MARPVADRAVLDTNVLLAATDEARQEHEQAVAAINVWPACAGKQVHDANVVATMLVHGVDTVVTTNVDDFARFGEHVHVADLPP
jgi:predicted nucleic acid-binding protein